MASFPAATLGKVGAVMAVGAGTSLGVLAITDGAGSTPAAARAWFDEPLDGTYYDAGPIHVVAHAAHPEGVVDVLLFVDGEQAETVDAGGDRLVDVELDWDPPGDGEFQLRVVGRDNDGDLTAPDVVTVGVGVEPSPDDLGDIAGGSSTTTTTLAEEATTSTLDPEPGTDGDDPGPTGPTGPGGTQPTPPTTDPTTPSTTPTTAPPCPGTPSLTSPGAGDGVGSAVTLIWSYSGCPIDGFLVEIAYDRDFARIHTSGLIDYPDHEYHATFACPDDSGRRFYWRITAQRGRSASVSPTRSFVVSCRGI